MRGGAILVAALWVLGCSGSASLQLPIEDPVVAGEARYLDAVREAIARYDVAKFEELIDAWWEVMEEAAKANPYKRFDAGHVDWFKGKVRARASWLEQWEKQALP